MDYVKENLEVYIGIDDINGNEMYTGDLLQHNENGAIYFIEYNKEKGWFQKVHTFSLGEECVKRYVRKIMWHYEEFEVVGNKHENREMMVLIKIAHGAPLGAG